MYRKKSSSTTAKRRKTVRAVVPRARKDRNGTVGPYLPTTIRATYVGNIFKFTQTCHEAVLNCASLAVPPGLVQLEDVDNVGNNVSWLANSPISPHVGYNGYTLDFPITPMFRFSDLPQYTDIQKLFDTVRIDYVELTVCNSVSNTFQSSIAADQAPQIPTMTIVYDTDDYGSLNSSGEAGQYSSAKTVVLNQGVSHSFRCKPSIATYAYRSTGLATPGYKSEPANWFNSAYPSVEHYAYKLWFNNMPAAAINQFAVRMSVRLFLSAKNTN